MDRAKKVEERVERNGGRPPLRNDASGHPEISSGLLRYDLGILRYQCLGCTVQPDAHHAKARFAARHVG